MTPAPIHPERPRTFAASEIVKFETVSNIPVLVTYNPGQHCAAAVARGFMFPSSRAQARRFRYFESMARPDVLRVSGLMQKYGFTALFQLTRSRRWCCLTNTHEFIKALRMEYNF